jgi:Tfp pilus assembly protein PilO
MPAKISRSHKTTAFFSIGFFILIIIVILFIYNPLIENTMKKRGRFLMSARAFVRHTSEINVTDNLEEENRLLRNELKKYSGISEEKISSSILKSLLKASNKSGVEFISIDPLDIREKNGFKYMKLNVMTKSGFHEIARFLSEVRRLKGLFLVDNVELEAKDVTSNEIASKIEISVYILQSE